MGDYFYLACYQSVKKQLWKLWVRKEVLNHPNSLLIHDYLPQYIYIFIVLGPLYPFKSLQRCGFLSR